MWTRRMPAGSPSTPSSCASFSPRRAAWLVRPKPSWHVGDSVMLHYGYDEVNLGDDLRRRFARLDHPPSFSS